ncbi:hypothetical protein IMG5_015740 [Ichthyophthirius multifiliis]|uniref:RNA helicase n=1 Tax=Ichthyophthirius multifiliis TaxID=5932 RepID=G0QKB9_ICHMU|nr:hypothetical protein IMG5_015740 [Ichthyophthirius multifiliis]EGR34336.1 hypothetical protein IMG5_015740 [Ichthyophthirius multifiliis]|eukprot:XP_004039640.1 hypothetical protein IMG5_015740 [Ichthyophthirius multifiliis]
MNHEDDNDNIPEYNDDSDDELNNKAYNIQKPDQMVANHSSFNDFNLKEDLLRSVKEAGFERPSEVQYNCIPNAIHGTDILCQAKAGTGKTAVFVLSILNQLSDDTPPYSCLVLCHTRELAFQIKNEFKRLGKYTNFKTRAIFGGVDEQDDIAILKQKKPQILVATPGRCLSLMNMRNSVIEIKNVKYFVVDECDRVMESIKMRSDVQEIFMKLPLQKQVMMFSGTIANDSKKICRKFMKDQLEIFIEDNSKLVLHGLEQYHLKLEEKQKIPILIQFLTQLSFNQVIIFVNKVERAMYLSKYLQDDKKLENSVIYRTLPQEQRTKVYQEFKEGKKRILVATDLFGRGIDIERVNLVINFDMPEKQDDYMHRVGRAGRFETKGTAISFVSTKENEQVLKDIQDNFSTKISEYNLSNISSTPKKLDKQEQKYDQYDSPKAEFQKTQNQQQTVSGQLKRCIHEDNQPVDEEVEFVQNTLGQNKIFKLQIIHMKNGGQYEGEWKNGMREGKGKHIWPDGSFYNGEWKEDKAHGYGKLIHVDGDIYQGQWENDMANGEGTYLHSGGAQYQGQWKNDLQNGYGVETWPDNAKYEGNYSNGKKNGKGTLYFADKSKHVGDFLDNEISGYGEYYWQDGKIYKGYWKNNKMNGKGETIWVDKKRYLGDYLDDKKHGFGIFEWGNGKKYEGEWRNGKQHGRGGEKKEGIWEDGKRIKWIIDE